jgi:hypothetical protein
VLRSCFEAICNAAVNGTVTQIRYLAAEGVIPRLCALFDFPDSKIILLVLEALDAILRVGKADAARDDRVPYADIVHQCDGLDWLKALQQQENQDIASKASLIERVRKKEASHD